MTIPLPVLPGVYYARVHGSFSGLPSTNVLTFATTPAPVPGTDDESVALDVANTIAAHWPAFALVAFSTAYTADEVTVYPLSSPLVPAQSSGMTAVGGVTGDVAPISTAGVVRHVVNRRGRGSQSRTFLTPLGISAITADGKSWNPTDEAAVTTAFDAFLSATITGLVVATAGVWEYVQLSKKGAGATFLITSSNAESALSTQRRRTRRNR